MATNEQETAELFAELTGSLGLSVVRRHQPQGPDLILLDTGAQLVDVQLKRLHTPTPSQVGQLVEARQSGSRPGGLRVLVADRIPEAVRAELRDHGWGWLDLRGHLHIAGQGVFIDTYVAPVKDRAERLDAFSGPAGLEVACLLLLEPDTPHGVRELARRLGRSPSTVSEVLGTLRKQGLASPEGTPVVPELFWETANAWQPREVPLLDLPRPGTGSVNAALRLGFDGVENEPGWALTGTLAAVLYQAPVAARSDHPPDFYVPSLDIQRRAGQLLGTAVNRDHRKASVFVAPVAAVCDERVDPALVQASYWATASEHWPLAQPLFVALDLARDPGRGREVLDGWDPPDPWRRVW